MQIFDGVLCVKDFTRNMRTSRRLRIRFRSLRMRRRETCFGMYCSRVGTIYLYCSLVDYVVRDVRCVVLDTAFSKQKDFSNLHCCFCDEWWWYCEATSNPLTQTDEFKITYYSPGVISEKWSYKTKHCFMQCRALKSGDLPTWGATGRLVQ